MANETSFQIDLGVKGGPELKSASQQLDDLTSKLTGAGQASEQASAAVRAAEMAYAAMESTADRTSKALEKINLQVDAQRTKLQAAMDAGDDKAAATAARRLRNLTDRQTEMAEKSRLASVALSQQAAKLDQLRGASDQASLAQKAVSKSVEDQKKKIDQLRAAYQKNLGTGNVRDLASGLGALGGPLGTTAQRAIMAGRSLSGLSSAVGAAGPYVVLAAAVVALTTATLALSAAAVAATASFWKFSVGLSDSARSASLLAAGIAGTTKGGKELESTVARLGRTVPQTSDELMRMAADLAKTGLRGEQLASALEEAAIKAARLKWGPDFAKQMLSLDVQSRRLKANISGLFAGLKLEKLLENFSRLVDLFDESNASGRAIKVVFESIFQPLTDAVADLLPKMVRGFLLFEIQVLKAMIAIKPWGSTILMVGKAIGALALIIGGGLAIALGVVVVSLSALAVGFGLVVAAVTAVATAFVWVGLKISELGQSIGEFFKTLDLSQMGRDMIDGLIKGITDGAGAVVKAMGGVVTGAIDGAKKLLGIASPSKVFAELGGYTAEGMAIGVEDGAEDVQSSMGEMMAPPTPAFEPASVPDFSAAAGAAGVNLAGAVFNFHGVKDAEQAEGRIRQVMLDILEGNAMELGAEVPA